MQDGVAREDWEGMQGVSGREWYVRVGWDVVRGGSVCVRGGWLWERVWGRASLHDPHYTTHCCTVGNRRSARPNLAAAMSQAPPALVPPPLMRLTMESTALLKLSRLKLEERIMRHHLSAHVVQRAPRRRRAAARC